MLLYQALMSLIVKVLRLICHSCTTYHLVLALLEHKDIVDAVIPGFDVADCQGIKTNMSQLHNISSSLSFTRT